ncbi:hypothetical protein BUALT_Bualt11G0134300 [Buddleja alternifolia]|uniref:DCD domain-containing protein n=1 Tax=Buddleja alternifolia TaxID=168488 RepID=A0AAV6WVR4_9LAMI|nr:hypothetical protein BUALT_Bualt11G0134300 [Buddleja alternifolia]
MGAGKKTQTFSHSETPPRMASNMTWARNLNKSQLGGVIFGCTKITMSECLSKQLFGLPAKHFLYVKNIGPGLPLLLFNYSERKLYGIYEAASSGQMNIDSYAWTEDGSNRTNYPAQVQICVRLSCQALPESLFKPIIADNYYTQNHFWFELDHSQAHTLMSKLSSSVVAPTHFTPENRQEWIAVMPEEKGAEPPSSEDYFPNSYAKIGTSTTSDDYLYLDENNQSMEASLCNQMEKSDEKDLIYMKLKESALSCEFLDKSETERAVENASETDMDSKRETHDNGSSSGSRDYPASIIAEAGAEQEIHRLENRCMILESISSISMRHAGGIESPEEFHVNLNESIFIVGGYDGVSWSSSLHSFLPSRDVLRSLNPMSSARSCTSVAKLNGELYVFGGGTGSTWCDTVESYNAVNNEWTVRPSLKEKKGSLAAAALDGKVFAVGGGNGVECFSDVEMFDPHVGRWISARSMLQKRFALAAVELNGVLYAVGGYDGNDYLKYALGGYDGIAMVLSVEIYDPRLGTWMTGEPMNQGRGYLAAAVLKESIYAIGGVQTNEEVVDKIECYKEGQGWEETNLRAVGKRSFASAMVLQGD